mgnify:CR=1 FL=1
MPAADAIMRAIHLERGRFNEPAAKRGAAAGIQRDRCKQRAIRPAMKKLVRAR